MIKSKKGIIRSKRGMTAPVNLFCIFIICRVIVCLTYIQSVVSGRLTSGMVLSAILAFAVTSAVTFPAVLCVIKNKNPLDIKGVRELYCLYFIFLCALNISRFSYFAATKLNPESTGIEFSIMIILAGAYAAYLGIESIGRFASFAALLVYLSIALVLIFNISNFHFINMFPLNSVPTGEILSDSVIISSNTIESVLILALYRKVNGSTVKPYIGSMAVAYAAIAIIFFFVIGVMGESASLMAFPVYSLSQLANIGEFERLDAIYMAFWIFAIFTKASVLIYAATMCFEPLTHKSKCIIISIAVLAMVMLVSNMSNPGRIYYIALVAAFAVFSFIIPVLTLALKKPATEVQHN